MMFVGEFTEALLSLLSLPTLSSVAAILVVGALLHWWTVRHHNETKAPNWTLLQLCNCLCVVLFITSTLQIFRHSSPDLRVPPGWGLICVICVVYFFSIFGVYFVASIIDDTEIEESVAPPERDGPRIPASVSRADCQHELHRASDRIAKAYSADEVWSESAILWHLTNAELVTLGMLREADLGRSVAGFCRRACGRCLECEWCLLLATWKEKAVSEISNTAHTASRASGLRGPRRRFTCSMPVITEALRECSESESEGGH